MEQELQDLLSRGGLQELADALDRRGVSPSRYLQLMRWYHHLDEMDLIKRRNDVPQGLFLPSLESPLPVTFVVRAGDRVLFVKVPAHLESDVRSLWYLDVIEDTWDGWGEIVAVIPPHGRIEVSREQDHLNLYEWLGTGHFVTVDRTGPHSLAATLNHKPELVDYLTKGWKEIEDLPYRELFDEAIDDMRKRGLLTPVQETPNPCQEIEL